MSRVATGYRYPSQRMAVFARNVVATSQPLAAQAGLDVLRRGGNAVDAAVAAAITLTVVEPTSNGIGSDAFALVWIDGALHGFNGSGRSPAAWTADRFAGRETMPAHGWESVTVPGAVDAWRQLSARFGLLPFVDLFAAAIHYATEGYAVSPITAERWATAADTFAEFPEFLAHFCPDGRPPAAGEVFRSADQAATLRAIAATGGDAFYEGELARKITADAVAAGGAMAASDLASHRGEFVEPVSIEYRGVRLHEIPPNGQGIAALVALGVLRHFDLAAFDADSPECLHLQIEAMKVGLVEVARHLADPAHMEIEIEDLLDATRLAARAAAIDPARATSPPATVPGDRGTVYLSAADANGTMVSFIQSNFWGFGSGVVVPTTGISLQNRGLGFSLEPGHPNEVAGSKRPYHTIIPAFLTKDGAPMMSFGVMGGHMQPQGHVQMTVRVVDFGQNPQTASDAPRWFIGDDGRVALEATMSIATVTALQAKGHDVIAGAPTELFGGAQLVRRTRSGGYEAGSDHRKDGAAVGF